MYYDKLLTLLSKHDVIKLFYFHKNLNFDQVATLAKTTKDEINKIEHKRIRPVTNANKIMIGRHVIEVQNISVIYKDKHNRNIVYIIGYNLSCALYLLKREVN